MAFLVILVFLSSLSLLSSFVPLGKDAKDAKDTTNIYGTLHRSHCDVTRKPSISVQLALHISRRLLLPEIVGHTVGILDITILPFSSPAQHLAAKPHEIITRFFQVFYEQFQHRTAEFIIFNHIQVDRICIDFSQFRDC